MQKLNFTFSSVSFSRFYRNRRNVKKLTQQGAKSLMTKAAAICSLVAATHLPAPAQTCNTLINADAANPILSILPPGATPYNTNFVDIDGDTDLDCYVSIEKYHTPFLYLNIGDATHPVYKSSAQSGFHNKETDYMQKHIQFVDIDGDGDYDCFTSDAQDYIYFPAFLHFYQNVGTPQRPVFYENKDGNPLRFHAGLEMEFQFADIDSDGDLDFYYHNGNYGFKDDSYDVVLWNKGTKTTPIFSETFQNVKTDDFINTRRVYYDWNHDGLLDYFASINEQAPHYYRNIGPKEAPEYVDDTPNGPVFANGAPYQFVDLNGDGTAEVVTPSGHYSTLAPVAVIGDTTIIESGVASRYLYSVNQTSGYQYQWDRNGKKIAGANSFILKVTSAGIYTLNVKSACGTGTSLSYRITGNTLIAQEKTAGTVNPSLSSVAVKAYPNPFADEFVVQLPPAAGAASTVRVTDLAGRILLSQTTSAGTVKLGNVLHKGMYLLQVFQNRKAVYTTKIAKQ